MKGDGTLVQIEKEKLESVRATPKPTAGEDDQAREASENELQHVCHYGHGYQDENPTIELNIAANRAENFVREIANQIGMRKPPEVMKGQVPNAMASIYRGRRVIVYNPSFMRRLNSQGSSDWAAYSVLAHELGHHLNGHTVERRANSWDREYEADYYSGYALARLGASLEDAQDAMRTMQQMYGGGGSTSHPPIERRLAEIEKGWKAAKTISSAGDDEDVFPDVPQQQKQQQCQQQCRQGLQCVRQLLEIRRQCSDPRIVCQECTNRTRFACCDRRSLMTNPYVAQQCQQCTANVQRKCMADYQRTDMQCRPQWNQCMQNCMNQ
jgi:hypothetical protein